MLAGAGADFEYIAAHFLAVLQVAREHGANRVTITLGGGSGEAQFCHSCQT